MVMGFLAFLCVLWDMDSFFWGSLFVLVNFILFAVNRYAVNRDMQRSIFILTMSLLSVYIVLTAKNTSNTGS